MPSSTFNSDMSVPDNVAKPWLVAGLAAAFMFIAFLELGLRIHGMYPQNRDTKELWAYQRARASSFKSDALILVGTSRIQLGIDLEEIEKELGKKAVQLAIDGTSYLPVLEDLASDSSITGLVLVSLTSGAARKSSRRYKSTEWLEYYNDGYKKLVFPVLENKIKTKMKRISVVYSSGMPLVNMFEYATGIRPVPVNYLATDARRERDADYTLISQPMFYLARSIRHLGKDVDMTGVQNLNQAISRIRKNIPVVKHKKRVAADFEYMNELVARIHQRGAHVVFVRFPTSGLVWEIDQAKSPKETYWDEFAKHSIAPTIHFKDYPELHYQLEDGSHLDKNQKKQFTRALAQIVREKLSL